MPGQAKSSQLQDEGLNRVFGEEESPVHQSEPGVSGTPHEAFLAALDRIWEVPVKETGMAVTFNPHRHA